MTQEELNAILKLHNQWLYEPTKGKRADLSNTNLSDLDFHGACLWGANFARASLANADLTETDLRGADLSGAILRGANLTRASLTNATLYQADLQKANLRRASIADADLTKADLRGAKNIPFIPMVCPDAGAFIGWKKVNEVLIVKLQIPARAKRSSATSRKCRCEYAKVLAIENLDGTPTNLLEVVNGDHLPLVTYRVGEIVRPDSFDEDRWNECSHGIHFFVNRQEAVAY